mmetsp:Transcript_36982/g.93409  ORF Transcript_36982/g.93409 Transcript_36982/m.93409 type:complete len:416 (+) Transcript_36982:173-1420(+)
MAAGPTSGTPPAVDDTAMANLAVAAVAFAVALGGALLPQYLFRSVATAPPGAAAPVYSLGLSIGNMLSAGVMLSAALVHLLAESFVKLMDAAAEDEKPFPWAMALSGGGFIITLVTAQLLEPGSGESRCVECIEGCQINQARKVSPAAAILTKGVSGNFEHHMWHDLVLDHSRCTHHVILAPEHAGHGEHPLQGHRSHSSHSNLGSHQHAQRAGVNECGCSEHTSLTQQLLPEAAEVLGDGEAVAVLSPLYEPAAPGQHQVGSFVLAVGLALHSCIEGAAIGAQDNNGDVFHVALAVLAHKGLTAYAVGSSLLVARATRAQYTSYLAVFTLATPAGILLGALLSSTSFNGMWSVCLCAVASGTFMYSAVVEVLGNELRLDCYALDSVHRTYWAKAAKLTAFILGFSLMSLVSMFE